jgi:hypothetical protein
VVSPTLLPHSLHLPRNTLLGLHINQLSVVFLEHLPNIPILGAHIHNTCHRKKYISSFKTPYMLRECEAQVPSTEDCAAVIFCCVSYKRNNTWNLAVPKNLQDIACQKSNERKCPCSTRRKESHSFDTVVRRFGDYKHSYDNKLKKCLKISLICLAILVGGERCITLKKLLELPE